MTENMDSLEKTLKKLAKGRPITAKFLMSLSAAADEQGNVPDQALMDALVNAIFELESASVQDASPAQDPGDVKVPVTLHGKTYQVSANSLRRRR